VTGDHRTPAALDGVAETTLWTLHHRALEARRPDAVLADPMAVALVERIDHPFAERFGRGEFAQWQGLRARGFDEEVRRFAARHPGGTVVALGEGLETQFWRVDDGRLRWLSVDLPEVMALRQELLPASSRLRGRALSALDPRWIDEVDASRGVLVTAQGLLMYLPLPEVARLIVTCARRLPGQGMVFDVAPRWLSERSRRGALVNDAGYRAPPWPWGMGREQERRIAALPGVASLRPVGLPRGRGPLHGLVLPALTRTPAIRRLLPATYRLGFSR
jgi:O-methyltransferase involved in polyketide biosynthesis